MSSRTKYQIAYQLGGRGFILHRTVSGAARALRSATRAAANGDDCQGIGLVAVDHTDADPYGAERPLDMAELAALSEAQDAL